LPALVMTWANSVGTGGVLNGLYFIARREYDFSDTANLLLAVVSGAIYIIGALGVGPALRALARRVSWFSTRAAAIVLCLGIAVMCALPLFYRSPAAVWILVAVYSPLAGAMWPIVESYVSGGRRDAALRRATSAFNLTWASAIPVAYWLVRAMLDWRPLAALFVIGCMHVVSAGIALALPREPAAHLEDKPHVCPATYAPLLIAFRWLLALSYLMLSVISPILPSRMAEVGLKTGEDASLASLWSISRLGVFILLGVWHGWHGRWRTVIWSASAMLLGAAAIIGATTLWLLLAGLALFGIGVGGIYSSAIYYAMAIGASEVDAGGKHEAIIGFGYTLGPLAGLAGIYLSQGEAPVFQSDRTGMLVVVGGFASLGVLVAVIRALRRR
jgi:MFS family permease